MFSQEGRPRDNKLNVKGKMNMVKELNYGARSCLKYTQEQMEKLKKELCLSGKVISSLETDMSAWNHWFGETYNDDGIEDYLQSVKDFIETWEKMNESLRVALNKYEETLKERVEGE